jgi:hypothetical protein
MNWKPDFGDPSRIDTVAPIKTDIAAETAARYHPMCSPSGAEAEPAPCGAENQLSGIFLLGEVDKVVPAAVHRQGVGEIKLLQLRHNLAQAIVRCRCQVEAADERIHLLDSTDLLGASQRIDNRHTTELCKNVLRFTPSSFADSPIGRAR